jgi:NAD(P)-dependent dehydrogenase (short-subunit alcohol dehydrogenase family)
MADMNGKIVLVTGATAGIGKETARALLRMGAHVVIVGRNAERTRQAVEELKASTGSSKIDSLLADLSSMADVRKLAREFLAKYDKLNVLVNNAGAVNMTREVTVDGYELTFATNHLAYFLLTDLLLPALEKGAPARIVNVSSEAHRGARIDFDDLMAERGYGSFRQYGRSKLANILFTRELARRLAGKPITVNSLHPGVVASNFLAKPGFWGVVGKISGLFMIGNEEGAKTTIYLASSPEVEGVTGKYWKKCKSIHPTREAQDDEAASRLWQVSEELTGLRKA